MTLLVSPMLWLFMFSKKKKNYSYIQTIQIMNEKMIWRHWNFILLFCLAPKQYTRCLMKLQDRLTGDEVKSDYKIMDVTEHQYEQYDEQFDGNESNVWELPGLSD